MKDQNELNQEKRKEEFKKKKCTEERLNILVNSYTEKENTIILDYVKPSQELVGILEESWKSNKFRWIHFGNIRNIANGDYDEHPEAYIKNMFRRHTSLFLQRIETLMNAFLLLSYEHWDPAVQDRSALILTRQYAHL